MAPIGPLAAQPAFQSIENIGADESVQVTIRLEPAAPPTGGEYMLFAQVVLAPGIHLYHRSLRFEWSDLQGVGQPEVWLPPGTEMPDPLDPAGDGTISVYEEAFTVTAVFPVTGAAGDRLVLRGPLHYQGCTDQVCYPPASAAFDHSETLVPGTGLSVLPGRAPDTQTGPSPRTYVATEEPEPEDARPAVLKWVSALVGAFVAGLLLSLTPCVYPMIPITAAVVAGATARGASAEGERRPTGRAFVASLIYVLGLSLVYALLGLASASAGAVFGSWLQSPAVLVPIAVVFLFLALVMLGAARLELPAGLGARLQGLGARGGFFGVFLVGAGAGLVASPCVSAPLAALLIEIARTGDRWLGVWTRFSLAWGMGVILVVAGTFSAALLPKAGVWMFAVKNLFGFVMLWAAVWVLRPLLGMDLYRLAAGLTVLAAVVYLGGLDALTGQSTMLQRTKRFAGLVALVGGMLYVVLGLGGVLGLEWLGDGGSTQTSQAGIPFVEADAQALDSALASGRPVLVDFHAAWCTFCREMERTTFREPEVVEEAARFVTLKVDVDHNPDLVARYRIVGVPTVLVFAPGERVPGPPLIGKVSSEELLSAMRQTR